MSFSLNDFNKFLIYTSESKITDIDIQPLSPIACRLSTGDIKFFPEHILTAEDIRLIAESISPDSIRSSILNMFNTSTNLDGTDNTIMHEGYVATYTESHSRYSFSYNLDYWKYRVAVIRRSGAITLHIRVILRTIPSFSTLSPDLQELVKQDHIAPGLYLVLGTLGSGKSTAVATIIEGLKQYHSDHPMHIVKIESHREYTHDPGIHLISNHVANIDYSTYEIGETLKDIMELRPDMAFIDCEEYFYNVATHSSWIALMHAAVSIPVFLVLSITNKESVLSFIATHLTNYARSMMDFTDVKSFIVQRKDWSRS